MTALPDAPATSGTAVDPATWLANVTLLLDVVQHPSKYLAPPGKGVSASDLLAGLKLLAPDFARPRPERAARHLAQMRVGNLKEVLGGLVEELVPTLIRRVAERPDRPEGTVLVSDFAAPLIEQWISWGDPLHPSANDTADIPLYMGRLDSLPADHPLHAALPDPYLYGAVRVAGPTEGGEPTLKVENAVPVVILGSRDDGVLNANFPRAWYYTEHAIALTRRARQGQVEGDRKFLEKLKTEALSSRARFWQSEEGRAELLRRRLIERRARGEIPAVGAPLPDPDARPGDSDAERERRQEELRQANEAWERRLRQAKAEARALRDVRRHDAALALEAKLREAEQLRRDGMHAEAEALVNAAVEAALAPQEAVPNA